MASKNWKATKSEVKNTEKGPWVTMVYDKGEEGLHAHFFPLETIEWRAAEYDLDPETDFDTIMDIIVHELHIPDPNNPENFETDAAAAKGMVSEAVGKVRLLTTSPVPTTLFNAETVEDAKAAMLERVNHCKANRVAVDTVPVRESLRAVFTQFLDRNEVEKKKVEVDRVRKNIASCRQGKEPGSACTPRGKVLDGVINPVEDVLNRVNGNGGMLGGKQ